MILVTLQEENKDYELLASNHLVGLWIGVYSLKQHRDVVSNIQCSTLARGVGGLLGNKGD